MIRKNTVRTFGFLAFCFLFSFGFNVLAQTKPLPSPLPQTASSTSPSFSPPSGLPSLLELKKLSKEEQIKLLEEALKKQKENKAGPAIGGCFDYYRFQSVKFNIVTNRSAYQPGDKVILSGSIKNENAYPVFDGNVFVRLAREGGKNRTTEGDDVVDEQILAEKIVLPAKGEKTVSFTIALANDLPKGKYTANFFFSVGKKFNLAGLPFTNEVVAGSISFTVDGKKTDGVLWDRSKTLVDGKLYKHIGNWPIIKEGEGPVISNTIINAGNTPQEVTISHDLYWWDSLLPSDKIETKTEKIVLKPGESRVVTYTTPALSLPVYYIHTTAATKDGKSIVNTRLTLEASKPRLNYVGLTSFPLPKEATTTLFACFHNTSNSVTEGTVHLQLFAEGKLVAEVSTTTAMGGPINVITKDIFTQKIQGLVTLVGEITDANGQIIDRYESVYDCKNLPESPLCPADSKPSPSITLKNVLISFGVLIFLGFLVFLGRFMFKLYESKK